MQVLHSFSQKGFRTEAAVSEKGCKPGLASTVAGVAPEPDDAAKHREFQEFLHRLCVRVDDYVSAASGMYAATRAMVDEFSAVLESDELHRVLEHLRMDATEAAEKRLAAFRHRVLAPFLREIQDHEGPRQQLRSQQRLPGSGPLRYEAAIDDKQRAVHESFAGFVTAQLECSHFSFSEFSPALQYAKSWLPPTCKVMRMGMQSGGETQTAPPLIAAQDSDSISGALVTRSTVSSRIPAGNVCAEVSTSDPSSEADCTPQGRSHRAASCPDAFLHFIAQTNSPVDGLSMSPPPSVQDGVDGDAIGVQSCPTALSDVDLLKDIELRPKTISEEDLLNMFGGASDKVPTSALTIRHYPLDVFDSMDGRWGQGALSDGLVTAPLSSPLASQAPLDTDLLMAECFL